LLWAGLFLFGFFGLVMFGIVYLTSPGSIQNTNKFEDIPINISHYGLFDLGVVDVNQDSKLDLFTSNHSGKQSVLVNQGVNKFDDVFSDLKLDQDQSFPGLTVLPDGPSMRKAGLYIYWQGPSIFVHAYKIDSLGAVTGKIEIKSPIKIEQKNNIKTTVKQEVVEKGVTSSTIEFDIKGDGHFSFKPHIHALPVRFNFENSLAPESIFVGSQTISPSTSDFNINMKDRHGLAWVDFNDDGFSDVYITRGGLRGWMGRMPEDYWDEFFISNDKKFDEIGKKIGFIKDGCSGREVEWIDYNLDNKLDLYVVCGKSREYQPNKLFEQMADGHFKDVAEQVGLNISSEGSFVWLDVDLDNDLDFFWVESAGFYLYENQDGKFVAHRLGSTPAGHYSKNLTVADFDADGDFDVFSVSPDGNFLCVNVNGQYVLANPVAWGLPEKSVAANWLDYNNDGLKDLHTIPDGLYLQSELGKFEQTSKFSFKENKYSYSKLKDALASWFDMDNDGKRDLMLALNFSIGKEWWANKIAKIHGASDKQEGLKSYWQTSLMRSAISNSNHWLQIDLNGLAGNRPGIGSLVTVSTNDFSQTQQVGVSEGSRYSQGHYRLYYGLGDFSQPVTVRIKWSDGYAQELKNIKSNQLLLVKR